MSCLYNVSKYLESYSQICEQITIKKRWKSAKITCNFRKNFADDVKNRETKISFFQRKIYISRLWTLRGMYHVCKGSRATSVRAHGDPHVTCLNARTSHACRAHECHPLSFRERRINHCRREIFSVCLTAESLALKA